MGTLLRVLTVFIFLLSILAFVMGYANFEQRELLIGRTHMLQEYVTKIAKTIEVAQPELPEDDPNSPYEFEPVEWDVDDVTARPNEAPALSDFWESYSNALEVSGSSFVRLDTETMEQELRQYYLVKPDPESGKPVVQKDSQGRPRTKGPGTMHDRLEYVLERATAQIGRLNKTREQLMRVRERLNEVAGLLNEEKKERRLNLRTIEELKAEIARLEDVIVTKDNEIAKLQREKLELEDTVQALNTQISEKDQTIQERDAEILRLQETIQKITRPQDLVGGGSANAGVQTGVLTPGVKGKVVGVNKELAFVIVELTPEAAAEVIANGAFQPVDMDVHRPGLDTIVTRVRITNPPSAARITIGDNVFGWEQTPVQIGDEVVF